jgi:nucleoside-diphosphate-sugar epimerase
MPKISILGCGWLGLPLAKALLEKNHVVKGSTTSEEKLDLLNASGIEPYIISLTSNDVEGNIEGFLHQCEILLIDIPPKLRGANSENFVQKIERLIYFIIRSKVEKVIFISSTSVYADDNTTINEGTKANPDTESGKQLLAAEKMLQHQVAFKTTVIRFAGLIGDGRHPIKSLAGRNISNPEGTINLIHQDDCIGIIESIVDQNIWGETFNAAAPYHPLRFDYYSDIARQLGLAMPTFNSGERSSGKIISSEKLVHVLNYTFQMPQL